MATRARSPKLAGAIREFVRRDFTPHFGDLAETFPTHAAFNWQTGYGAFTVSASAVKSVIAYVEGQKQHHWDRTFEEEFVTFLRRHGVGYDERYLWG